MQRTHWDLTRQSCSSSQVTVFKPPEGILPVVERDRFARLVVSEPYAECLKIVIDAIDAPFAMNNRQLSGPDCIDPFRISSLGLAVSEKPHSLHLIEGSSQGAFNILNVLLIPGPHERWNPSILNEYVKEKRYRTF